MEKLICAGLDLSKSDFLNDMDQNAENDSQNSMWARMFLENGAEGSWMEEWGVNNDGNDGSIREVDLGSNEYHTADIRLRVVAKFRRIAG